jgi:tetratricopeptide (TPR) repeat protein
MAALLVSLALPVSRGAAQIMTASPPSAGAPPAAGQETQADEYNRLIREGLVEYEQRNWPEALTLFERAHAVQPNARTLRAIGNVAFEMRKYTKSIDALRASLSDSRKPLTQTERVEVENTVERALRYVATLRVTVKPANATLLLDGAPIAQRELTLDMGEYRLGARAPGYKDSEVKLNLSGGQTRDLAIDLVADENAAPEPSVATAAQPARRPAAPLGPWIVIGTSGAIAIAGAVLLVLAQNDVSTVEDAKMGSHWDDVESAYDRAPVLSTLGAVGLGAGLAGVAAGVYWEISAVHDASASEHAAALRLRMSPAGMSLHAAF